MIKLRIEGKGATAHGYRVFLDDQDVSNSCRGLRLDMAIGDVNTGTVELDVYVDRLDLDAALEAKLIPQGGRERTSFLSRIREFVGA